MGSEDLVAARNISPSRRQALTISYYITMPTFFRQHELPALFSSTLELPKNLRQKDAPLQSYRIPKP